MSRSGCRLIYFRRLKDIDIEMFHNDLRNAPWEHILNCQHVDEAWFIWHSICMAVINHHACSNQVQACSKRNYTMA